MSTILVSVLHRPGNAHSDIYGNENESRNVLALLTDPNVSIQIDLCCQGHGEIGNYMKLVVV
jgi:hypothetical protein